jgi:hypothetical protein
MNKASPATNKAGTKDTSHLRDIFTIMSIMYMQVVCLPVLYSFFNYVFPLQ